MIDMRAIMERCANIYGAASCLHFLNDQESIYTIRPHEQHAELDMLWTMMPLSPKPVSISASTCLQPLAAGRSCVMRGQA